MRTLCLAAVAGLLVAAAGCGGGGSGSSALQDGVYESNVTSQYLKQHGETSDQAVRDAGRHVLTLQNGSFSDTWKSAGSGSTSCSGKYEDDSGVVTFTWISGCFGDWSAKYAIDGDRVTWSGAKALPPHDSAEDQRQAEISAAVPWTRTGDVPSS
jgi:hypothetical protein